MVVSYVAHKTYMRQKQKRKVPTRLEASGVATCTGAVRVQWCCGSGQILAVAQVQAHARTLADAACPRVAHAPPLMQQQQQRQQAHLFIGCYGGVGCSAACKLAAWARSAADLYRRRIGRLREPPTADFTYLVGMQKCSASPPTLDTCFSPLSPHA
jgi:hypothetical protein